MMTFLLNLFKQKNSPEPEVIFEDEEILVINKPSGLLVHGEGTDPSDTLVEWFLKKVPKARGVGEKRLSGDGEAVERSGVVHRLDKDTSGVMVLAKTQSAFDHLKIQFQQRLAKKEYRALVYGKMNDKWGTITRKIGRNSKDWKLRSAEHGARGHLRDAVTDWECLSSGEYKSEPFSYLKLRPKTGRTHQLRVHLKAFGRPIVGDSLYAKTTILKSNNLGLERLALHSTSLRLILENGEEKIFTCLLPRELEKAVELIAK